jgi:lysophospholipase L1-like esterase
MPAEPPAVTAPPEPEPEPARRADVASEPLGDAFESDRRERHEALLRAPERATAEVVLIGDAVADSWFSSRAFQKKWGKRRPLNLAIAGDQTQHLLWRIEQGALDGLSPRLVIVAVGSQNLADGFSAAETARGIRAVLGRIREKVPSSGVMLVGLLPSGQSPEDPRRAEVTAVNAALRDHGLERVVVTDVGGVFLDADGSISPTVMSDYEHPTPLGYEALTLSVSLVAQRLLDGAR